MYIKKEKKIFSSIFYNIDSFIQFVKNKLNYLNVDNLLIYNKLINIYEELMKSDYVVGFKLKIHVKDKFNFKYKNRLQVEFWEERGHSNSLDIVSKIQKVNSEKVKNRFLPNSENLSKLGYTKDDIKGWRCGPNFIINTILLKCSSKVDDIFYATKNKEYKINKSKTNGYWLYDFVDIGSRKIIEFQGDRFHANPNLFKPKDRPHPFNIERISEDIWNDDKIKKEDAENENFSVFYVWESEYNYNESETVERCLNFLEGKHK